MRRIARSLPFIAAVWLATSVVPVVAQDEKYAESLRSLQQLDARVQTVGWHLAQGNAQYCSATRPAIGLLLQDIMGYNRPTAARNALAVQTDFAVQAVAQDSPAQRAGLTPNQPITAIDGRDLSKMVRNAKAPYLRLKWAEAAVQRGLDTNGKIDVILAGETEPVTIAGEAICAASFVVRPSDDKAAADAKAVYIGGKFAGLAYADDELAAAAAHELAHVLLSHPQWLAENGRKLRDVRHTEREADRLMPWLLFNAGYAPEAAMRFMTRWGKEEDSTFLAIRRTHDGWDERVELIEAEIAVLRQIIAEKGAADWSQNFVRQPKT
ncbi:hypothetical protein [Pontixanthobacter sp. CEM42]|uniref:hypothetical protein n=1 Tax=Pontixanthobacter sp. CEM42 TaxID=2792077 RepID=UPI001AE04E30|nr:hypothetical protein [Pontixanthobacter sp. CEM42]